MHTFLRVAFFAPLYLITFGVPCHDAAAAYNCGPDVLSDNCCVIVHIQSDPPGARVYGQDGDDWGVTAENYAVTRYFWKSGDCDEWEKTTITLKKRGYKPTRHTFLLRYKELPIHGSPQQITPNFRSFEDMYRDQRDAGSMNITVILDSE